MSSKNRSFAAGLMGSLDEAAPQPEAPTRMPVGILASRENRMAELAAGAVVGRAIEQVDPPAAGSGASTIATMPRWTRPAART
jgi:hypothetical protein